MNRQLLFSAITSVFITAGAFAQTKSKTFKETFSVGDNAILNINTSNADIEFETWDKNEVAITAVIELEGATNEEAELYFSNGGVIIKGNSKEIDITTGGESKGLFSYNKISRLGGTNIDFDVEPLFEDLRLPELAELSELSRLSELSELAKLSELSKLSELAVIPEMPVIPTLPNMPNFTFDYGQYKKDGEKYMKKWKKQFDKGFDEEFKKNFEEWGKKFEELNEKRNEKLIERLEQRKEQLEKRNEKYVRQRAIREQQRQAARAQFDSIRAKKDSLRFFLSDSLRSSKPNIFYFFSDKDSKRYKVKKTIKVKMPKSVKLKMNVRHGEVKLAQTTNNLEASLQYASLLASTIEGSATNIRASYSPISVQKWNYGQLKTDYSERVNLKEVGELRLNAISSNVIIDKLNNSILLTNKLGAVEINTVSNNFKDIDVTVQNGEFTCKVPKTAVSLYLNGTRSNLVYPTSWKMERTKNFDNEVCKGYQTNGNSGKSIRVNSKYSEVVLKN